MGKRLEVRGWRLERLFLFGLFGFGGGSLVLVIFFDFEEVFDAGELECDKNSEGSDDGGVEGE